MKKNILIGLFPTIMVLSACGGLAPNGFESGKFLEDTLLHEEIFGDFTTALKSIRNLDPADPNEPRIAVQYAPGDGKVSIRYVAAINIDDGKLASYSATWSRDIYDVNGNRVLTGEKACTKVYEQLNGGILPSSFGSYNYFVVYSLRDVPTSAFGGALLASLTIDDGEDGDDPITTKKVATTLNVEGSSIRTSLTEADLAIDGYFLKGTIAGVANSTRVGESKNGYLSYFDGDIYDGDSFVAIYNHNDSFKVLNPSLDGDISTESFTNSNGKIMANRFNLYHLYLTNDNKLQTVTDFPTDRILNFTNESGTKDKLTLYVTGSLSDYLWSWNALNQHGLKLDEAVTGRFLYVDSTGAKTIYNDFEYMIEGDWTRATFKSSAFNSDIAITTLDSLSFTLKGTSVNFSATGEKWRDAIIGPELNLSNLKEDNPRIVKSTASYPANFDLYLYVFSTNNPGGFVWPSMAQQVDVYGLYFMVENDTSIVNISRFKYRLGGEDGDPWTSHFESIGIDDVTSEYLKSNEEPKEALHVVVRTNEGDHHFDIIVDNWQNAILGPKS